MIVKILMMQIFLFAFGAVWCANAGDKNREAEFADNLQQQQLLGKVIWLQADGQRFLSLYSEAEKSDNSNAAILLHDMGETPDHQLIHNLRLALPHHNWATIAVQMPLRESIAVEADYYPLFSESQQRITSAIEYLQKNGTKKIILIGYGLGAMMAANLVSEKSDNLAALVTISLAVPETTVSQAQTLNMIKNISLPFLDIYAEFDLPTVVDTARQRRMAGKENPVYRQVLMNGENHAYQQDSERLVKRVYSWLGLTFQP